MAKLLEKIPRKDAYETRVAMLEKEIGKNEWIRNIGASVLLAGLLILPGKLSLGPQTNEPTGEAYESYCDLQKSSVGIGDARRGLSLAEEHYATPTIAYVKGLVEDLDRDVSSEIKIIRQESPEIGAYEKAKGRDKLIRLLGIPIALIGLAGIGFGEVFRRDYTNLLLRAKEIEAGIKNDEQPSRNT